MLPLLNINSESHITGLKNRLDEKSLPEKSNLQACSFSQLNFAPSVLLEHHNSVQLFPPSIPIAICVPTWRPGRPHLNVIMRSGPRRNTNVSWQLRKTRWRTILAGLIKKPDHFSIAPRQLPTGL
jgi:hypothetical protein